MRTATRPVGDRRGRVRVAGVTVDAMTELEVVDHVVAAVRRGEGGHVVTPNIDVCLGAARDPEVRALVEQADVAVPDGMPLVWASRLLGTPVPARITGADLIWSLSEAAAFYRVPVYLLGGPPGAAERAAVALMARYPDLIVAGADSPPAGFEEDPAEVAKVRRRLVAAGPGLVFVGLGFPAQDRLVAQLRGDLPATWFVGCGSAITFAAGTLRRAPLWMRSAGLEWLYRVATEPGRLSRRYLVDGVSFALRLLAVCLLKRLCS